MYWLLEMEAQVFATPPPPQIRPCWWVCKLFNLNCNLTWKLIVITEEHTTFNVLNVHSSGLVLGSDTWSLQSHDKKKSQITMYCAYHWVYRPPQIHAKAFDCTILWGTVCKNIIYFVPLVFELIYNKICLIHIAEISDLLYTTICTLSWNKKCL